MRKLKTASRLCAALFIAVQLSAQETKPPAVTTARDSLQLSGNTTSVSLSPADFHALPHMTVTVRNSRTGASETYSGVELATLLARINAPLGKDLRGHAMTSYLIAIGSDGYSVGFSLAEVDPAFHQGQVIVADTREGQPLGKNGPFQLIVSDDKRPARWVHNLITIILKRAE